MSGPPVAPPPRRAYRLFTLAVIVLVVGALHVTALFVYLGAGVARRARDVGTELSTTLSVFEDLHRRSATIRSAVVLTSLPVPSDTTAVIERAAQLRAQVERVGIRAAAMPFARVPAAMRVPLARADDDVSRLQNALLEVAALLEVGRIDEAIRRHARTDSLMARLQGHLAEAQEAGLADLRERELALRATAGRAVQVLVVWVLSGLLLLGFVFWVLRVRVMGPLLELEAGLHRVAAGELAARVPVRRTDELGRVAALFNETARVLQQRAEQQGRFAAAGELIAGVAHEVNNPLMAVAAIAELQTSADHLAPEVREEFAQVGAQAQRAGRLLAGLLRFVRPHEPTPGPADINAMLERAVELLSYRLRVEEVEVTRELDGHLPPPAGDAMRLEQVFVNLTSNALDALRAAPRPRRLMVRTWQAGDEVCVSVTDNGPGVPPEVRSRLFAPFVTSKGDRGTGLGLYISRQVVRGAGGEIVHEARPEGGASFVVRLPRAPDEPPADAPSAGAGGVRGSEAPEPVTAPPGAVQASGASLGGLSVLIIEDEVAIRRVIERFLRGRGAQVTTANDGLEALGRLKGLTPDILLMDLKMPGMSGAALYDVLRRERPELAARTLVWSGDLSQLEELDGQGAIPPERIIAKPISLQDLEQRMLALAGRGG